jgi:adenine-specific DNA-methyltransferase
MMEKIEKGHPLTQSPDFVKENIEILKKLFPTILKEGKIDSEELHALLGYEVVDDDEYYRFTWSGKSMARREANKPSTGTLRPDKAASKHWDATQNIFIEGDNLEVLKLMQKSYSNQIKMIYIDPPYNTGNDFVYPDNYDDNLKNYLAITDQTDAEGRKKSTNTESDGRYHSNWLNMMYPRLKLARNLLKDDGVIFISIDDNELINLRKVCDEVFGEDQFEANIIPIVNPGGRDYKQIAITNEYLLVYSKSNELELNEIEKKVDFKFSDINGGYDIRELRNRNPKFHSGNRPNLFYSFYVNPNSENTDGYCLVSLIKSDSFNIEVKPYNSIGSESVWRWGKEKVKNNIHEIDFDKTQVLSKRKSDGNWNIYEKNRKSTSKAKSLWDETEMRTENGTRTFRSLFDKSYFDHPKPTALIKKCVIIATNESDKILDFFAGSGTTAHAVMQLNAEDGGSRKCISVQLPEPTDGNSEAFKAGYTAISEITKERIRRAGDIIVKDQESKMEEAKEKLKSIEMQIEKAGGMFADDPKVIAIKEQHQEVIENIEAIQTSLNTLDIGFKAFKLDSSNIRTWDGNPDSLDENLFTAASNIKEDRTEEDILYEILLKYGLDLAIPQDQKEIAGKTVYNIGMGALFICLADGVTTAVAEGIGQWKRELDPATCKVIFKDTGFTDVEKTNSVQILKRYGIDEVSSV